MTDHFKKTSIGLYVLFIIVVLAWGLSWPVNKLGLQFIPPLWFASSRLVFGTISMFVITIVLRKCILPSIKDLPLILSLGIFQIGLFILLINLGLSFVSSEQSAILVYTTPLWVMPMAIFFFKEPSSMMKWIGFLLGIVGVLIMLNPWKIDWTDKSMILGMFFLMSASLSLSISILCARYMTWHHTPIELISWQLLVGALIVSITTYILQPNPLLHFNLTANLCIGYTAIAATAFGFWGMSIISKELPATITSLGILGVPISGVIFSVLLLHEVFQLYMFFALVLITFGLFCVLWDGGKKSD